MILAISTSSSISISITYILLLTKLQKSQIPEKGPAPIEKRYHNQVKRCQNSGYIAGIKSMDNKKAEPFADPASFYEKQTISVDIN